MRKVLEQCPSCGGTLAITGMQCTSCDTGISGRFSPCDFCRLNDEQSTFVRLFVERRGNLSEMEKALGISYPTVRNKLEEIIRALQQPTPRQPAAPAPSARDLVLREVAAGQISAEEALTRLQALNGKEE
jgi:hypothetical protein